jgi:hypothetical protein
MLIRHGFNFMNEFKKIKTKDLISISAEIRDKCNRRKASIFRSISPEIANEGVKQLHGNSIIFAKLLIKRASNSASHEIE